MRRPSLTLPLVAYRGLWDKFAEPRSVAAIRRAYRRDVACVVRSSESESVIAECCAIAADPINNRERLPLLMVDDRVTHGAAPLFLFGRSHWLRCGVYVPVRRAHAIERTDLNPAVATAAPWVLVESMNVVQVYEEHTILAGASDDEILSVLMEMAPASAQFARVSDFVELDFLDRQREAA